MRLHAVVLLLLTPLAHAQVLLSPGELARVRAIFESRRGAPPLRCDMTPLAPEINFAFRFQAGYTFQVPQSQYSGSAGAWSILTAITPEDGASNYLLAHYELPDVSRTDSNFEIRGAYFLGVGRYSVESTLRDDSNRVCRKQWQVVVQPSAADRGVPLALPPGTVRQFLPVISPRTQQREGTTPMRLTILLNAAAFSTFRTAIRPYDREVLIGALTSLLEHLPATSARLVVFSLEQQKEVFRAENFSPPDVGRAARAIRSMQQGTVDVHVLQKPLGHVDFLAGLIGRELATNPSDNIVFLGPTSRYGNKIPMDVLPAPAEAHPRFFYIRYEAPRHASSPAEIPGVIMPDTALPGSKDPVSPDGPAGSGSSGGRGGGGSSGGGAGGGGSGGRGHGGHPIPPQALPFGEGQTDVITAAMRRLKGKTLTIHTPADLARAIRKIEGGK
jgi:uncharacterized membrane protein YgcG